MGLVALHASQDNNGRVLHATGLGFLNGSLTALLGRFLVTGADECGLLVRLKIGVQRNDWLGRVGDQGGRRIGLLRAQYNGICALIAQRGLDHVELLFISRCRSRRQDLDRNIVMLIRIGLCTCHDLLEVAIGQLYNDRDVVGFVRRTRGSGGIRCRIARGIRIPAATSQGAQA